MMALPMERWSFWNGYRRSTRLCFAWSLINGKVILLLGLVAGVFSIAGNYLGTRCFDKGGAKFVKPLMMVVLVIFFVKTLSEILGA